MTQKAKSWASFLSLALFTLSTARCGQKVCVAGIGDCAATVKTNQEGTNGTKMKIVGDTSDLKGVNMRREFSVEGGQGKITVSLQGSGSVSDSSAQHFIYTSPSTSSTFAVVLIARDQYFKDEASDPDHLHWATIHFLVVP